MTLIAGLALRQGGCLLGDILLSQVDNTDTSIPVPTYTDTRKLYTGDSKLVIKGTCQKIHLINDNIALAWSGKHIAARTVVNEITQEIKRNPFTFESLSSYLKNNETINHMGLEIIAMYFDTKMNIGRLVCNTSMYDSKLLGNVFAGGSGANNFISMFKSLEIELDKSIKDTEQDIGINGIVASLVTQLLASDFTHGPSLINYYGGGYEVLLAENRKLSKLDNITYVFWLTRFREEGDIGIPEPVQIHVYKYIKDVLTIRALHINRYDNNREMVNQIFFVPPVTRNISKTEIDTLLNSEASFLSNPTYISDKFHHIFLIQDKDDYIRMWFHFKKDHATVRLTLPAKEQNGLFINYNWSWLFEVRDKIRIAWSAKYGHS